MDEPEDPHLLSAASRISDGSQVDWPAVNSQAASPGAGDLLRELIVLERIARFHRSPDPSGPTDPHDRATELPASQTWGHFRITECIGYGAFGAVYRATDTRLQSDVALKLLRQDPSAQTLDPAVVLKEARLLARVRHPNVVTVQGADCLEGQVGIWMEFVKGRSLEDLLNGQGPFGAREAALIGLDLCRALAAVHRAGLLHGDIKAQNVMREEGGRTVLMDFGTGKDLTIEDIGPDRAATDFAGTPLYVAPEVFAGQPRSKASDTYSLGVLLYHLVTGAYPVYGKTRADVERAHASHERRTLRDARPDLPEDFVRTVERALATDPRERYQSAGEFETALGAVLGRVDPPIRRRTWPAIAAALATIIVAAGVYWAVSRGPSVSEQNPAAAVGPAAANADYRIEAALYRLSGDREDRLREGTRVQPGDQIFAKIRVSLPAYVYIVNEDDRGDSYLLFPLPGQKLTNPLSAGLTTRIPGGDGASDLNWQVTSAGGREHFLVFASPERLQVFEQMFATLPVPEVGRRVESVPLPETVVGRLRGVGGLVASQGRGESVRLASQFSTPLGDGEERVHGVWVRQLTLENPIVQR